ATTAPGPPASGFSRSLASSRPSTEPPPRPPRSAPPECAAMRAFSHASPRTRQAPREMPATGSPPVPLAPASTAFTLLLGFLVALPSFGIDMSLPALAETAAALRVAPAEVGSTMSLFMLGFAVAPLLYGPASDRYGRKPIVVLACLLFIIAGIGCALARSLPALLMWRVVQGAGAGASMTIALAIVRDLFDGQVARTKLSYVAIAT